MIYSLVIFSYSHEVIFVYFTFFIRKWEIYGNILNSNILEIYANTIDMFVLIPNIVMNGEKLQILL